MLRGSKSNIQLCIWKLDWAHDRNSLGIGKEICHPCGDGNPKKKPPERTSAVGRKNGLNSSNTVIIALHVPFANNDMPTVWKRGSRRTPYSYTLSGFIRWLLTLTWFANWAPLCCVCAKYKSLQKNLRIFLFASFSCFIVIIHNTVRFKSCCCVLRFAVRFFEGPSALVFLGIGDETHFGW